MVKAAEMPSFVKTALILIGMVKSASSFLTTGNYVMELSTPSTESISDYKEMGKLNHFLHLFSLNQSSEYLMRNLTSGEYSVHKSVHELDNKNHALKIWQKIQVSVDIRIIACGYDDSGCGRRAPITINGVDSGLKSRGFHVVLLAHTDGRIVKKQVFDTHGSATASNEMKQFIHEAFDGTVVVIAVRDTGNKLLGSTTKDYIKSLGSRHITTLGRREALAIVTSKGQAKPPWFAEVSTERWNGPSILSVKLLL